MPEEDKSTRASDGLAARLTGPWVYDKNHYVDRYFDIFTRRVGRKWRGNLAYVDLFAGYGRNLVRETNQEVDGSPLLALKHAFAKYVFVDLPDVLRVLDRRLAKHTKRDLVELVPGNCNAVVDKVLAAVPRNYLTLAFIDPTGTQIRFETIRRLVHNRKVDLLMTIQFGMAIRMNLPQYARAERAALTEFLGTSKWREDYSEPGSISQIGRRVLDRYVSQLGSLGYSTVRDREIEVRSDQKNLFLYVIVLASRHPLGAKYWRAATALSRSGQRRLSGLVFEE